MADVPPNPIDSTDIVWRADEERAAETVTARFMEAEGIATYPSLVGRSVSDPDWFWDATVRFLGIPFQRPYTVVADRSEGPQWTTWFPDGALNLSEVCVDRWAAVNPDQPALVSENERGDITTLTFGELKDRIGRTASVLESPRSRPGRPGSGVPSSRSGGCDVHVGHRPCRCDLRSGLLWVWA